MLKAAFYQVEQCQEPPEEIRAEMQEFAADVGLGFHAFYMDSPKPWYLSEPSSVLRKMVEDASERKFDILIIERMSDFTNCCMDAQKVLRAMKKQGVRIFYWNEHTLELDEYTDEPTSQLQTHLIIENIARQEELRKMKNILRWQFSSHEATQ